MIPEALNPFGAVIPPATGNQSDETLRTASTTDVRETMKASCRRTMPSQRRIGLTGGIASGKSSVGRWLSDHDIPVLDADRYARDALAPGSAGCQAVLKRYGPAVAAHGAQTDQVKLNRQALADIVFSDAMERQWLEQLVHPLVRQAFDKALHGLEQTPTVVLMVPLLYESGLEGLCTEVWVVHCSREQQQQRLIQRNGLSAQQADQRIEAQWPLERKCQLANQVIDNSGEPDAWSAQVLGLLRAQTQPFGDEITGWRT